MSAAAPYPLVVIRVVLNIRPIPQGTCTIATPHDTKTRSLRNGINAHARFGHLWPLELPYSRRQPAARCLPRLHHHGFSHAARNMGVRGASPASDAMKRTAGWTLLISACAWSALAASPTASALLNDIHQQGARVVVAHLSAGNGDQWTELLKQISTGQSEWLKVASMLRSGTDAATGEDLTDALAHALRTNPEGVLSLTGNNVPLFSVCNVPLIEPTDAQVAQWKAEALKALSRVTDAGLASKAAACRADFAAVPAH